MRRVLNDLRCLITAFTHNEEAVASLHLDYHNSSLFSQLYPYTYGNHRIFYDFHRPLFRKGLSKS